MHLAPLAFRRDPIEALACLGDEPGAFLLEVPDPDHPATLVGCRPVDELRIDADARDPLAAMARFVARAPVGDAALPFPLGGGVVACLTYELGVRLAPRAIPARGSRPLAVLRRYDPLLVHDRAHARWSILASDAAAVRPPWLERLSRSAPSWRGPLGGAPLEAALPAARHRAAVQRILAYLAAGDCYQVNLTQPFTAPVRGPAWALFQRLARLHPAPFASYLDLGDATIVGNSPELLLRRRGRRVETRPIKGTRPRGRDPAHDAALAVELARDPKERAEHVMIVDLERNDLGRVCVPGSVHVDRLFGLESHPTVHHLVSRVAGTLREDVDVGALLAAVFPGGSITGAPKIRAMEIIGELEEQPRGVYTGALGLLSPTGDLELGLPIRTAVVSAGGVSWHAGGGIVADSDPERELAEAWLKTQAIRLALGERAGTERGVLVWLNGRFVRARDARISALDRGLLHGDGLYDTWRTYDGEPFAVAAHVRRLAAAARALRLPPPGSANLWARRARAIVRRNGLCDATVRLTVTRGAVGEHLVPDRPARPTQLMTVRRLPADLAEQQAHGISAVLLPFPRDVAPPWGGLKLLGHPSAVIGRTLALRRGAREGLYVTPGGEVTEGCTSNLFLVEDGVVHTPPATGGILGGVTRDLVLRLARRAGLAVCEEPIAVRRLRRAAEAFVTASTVEILPVVRLDGQRLGAGRPGPVTAALQQSYRATVAAALRRARVAGLRST